MSLVSEAALVARINRRLKADDAALRKTRGARGQLDLGDYWVQDFRRNLVLDKHVDPETMARELGLIRPFEQVRREEESQ